MKRQILKCLLNVELNGIVSDLALYLKKYLMNNKKMAQSLFYTIIALAEDEMSCYKYNASNLQNLGKEIEYQPNRNIPPHNVEELFEKNGIDPYNSKKDEIIQRYLLNEESKDLSSFNIENCNIQTLCFISNCGLTFENLEFKSIMKKIFPYMISIVSKVKNDYRIISFDAVNEIKEFINRSFCGTEEISDVVDMMFDLVDFNQLNADAYEIYETISANLLAFYFDGYNKLETRKRCEVVLTSFENKITKIRNENARKTLYKMLFLISKRFYFEDWNNLKTKYSYEDKMFLNEIWGKYGWIHLDNLLFAIYEMHISELVPEIIISLNESLNKYLKANSNCINTIKENEPIINRIITKSFLDCSVEIKADIELTKAFEELLETLVRFGMEEAAVILDEFRIH